MFRSRAVSLASSASSSSKTLSLCCPSFRLFCDLERDLFFSFCFCPCICSRMNCTPLTTNSSRWLPFCCCETPPRGAEGGRSTTAGAASCPAVGAALSAAPTTASFEASAAATTTTPGAAAAATGSAYSELFPMRSSYNALGSRDITRSSDSPCWITGCRNWCKNKCCFFSWRGCGRSDSFSDFTRFSLRSLHTSITASRSCAESPIEIRLAWSRLNFRGGGAQAEKSGGLILLSVSST
mmetsp:Transcript_2195/g.5152  ORF Transcript_2195/g.5152 Transcript_2195/m.5152 type:complete len:239 (-) Transcript_2195:2281-2997(-)